MEGIVLRETPRHCEPGGASITVSVVFENRLDSAGEAGQHSGGQIRVIPNGRRPQRLIIRR